jgi:hypothetical protein
MKDVNTNEYSGSWERLWYLHPPKLDSRFLQNLTSHALKNHLRPILISRVVVGVIIEIDELREKASFGQKLLYDWIGRVWTTLRLVKVKNKDVLMIKRCIRKTLFNRPPMLLPISCSK